MDAAGRDFQDVEVGPAVAIRDERDEQLAASITDINSVFRRVIDDPP